MAASRPMALSRLHPLIGRFVIQYATVQGTMRTLLLALLHITEHRANTLLYGMSDEVVLRKVQISLKQYGSGYRDFDAALKDLREVAEFRNQLLHWVPNMNPSRTTLTAMVDAWKDYTNPNDLQVCFTSSEMVHLTRWLQLFEGDLVVMLMALKNKERFDKDMYRTLQGVYRPTVPKPGYESGGKAPSNKKAK